MTASNDRRNEIAPATFKRCATRDGFCGRRCSWRGKHHGRATTSRASHVQFAQNGEAGMVTLPLPLAGEGWGGGYLASPDAERAPTRLALARNCAAELGTLPRKRERGRSCIRRWTT